DDHALVVTSGVGHGAPRAAAPSLMWGTASMAPASRRNPRLDPLLDPALPVGFAAIHRYDGLLDPASEATPAARPVGLSMPLQASLRPLAPAPTAVAGLPIPALEPAPVPAAEASLATPAAAPE
ncbi:hypothetical protein, partial [Acinetobacter baumannii]|uniref:hypothetical protein n=1 Tax=Acinetobacter baumannii TaxID=470 RepID=UPI002091AFB1